MIQGMIPAAMADTQSSHHQRVAEIQQALRETPGLDGWLFYDFRGSDPRVYWRGDNRGFRRCACNCGICSLFNSRRATVSTLGRT